MRVAGADGWKGRWVVVLLEGGRFERAFLAATIEEVLGEADDAAAVGIDIPIGLPPPGHTRPADHLARAYVGRRQHSVFLTPPGEVFRSPTHAAANGLARERGWPGVSAQAYALRHLVLQVERVAAGDPRVHEVHPEVSFVRANGDRPLAWAKTSWNGAALRRGILRRQGVVVDDDIGPAGAAEPADVLDAAAVAWTAARIAAGAAEPFPEGAERLGAIWR